MRSWVLRQEKSTARGVEASFYKLSVYCGSDKIYFTNLQKRLIQAEQLADQKKDPIVIGCQERNH